jgi:hypothetical protein
MNINQVYDSFTDSLNCNLKEREVIKCFNELDKKIFFKTKKYKKCIELDEQYKHCLVYANQNKIYKRETYRTENVKIDIYLKYLQSHTEKRKDTLDYLSGKISEDDLKNKKSNSPIKLIEL